MGAFNGVQMHLGNLSLLSNARTRSISAENPTGEPGKGGMATEGVGMTGAEGLGQGWKISPAIFLAPHAETVIAEIKEAGVIQHIWCTCLPENWRFYILKMYWDGEASPSVEVPLGDFFAMAGGSL